jgi:hypothetical protein
VSVFICGSCAQRPYVEYGKGTAFFRIKQEEDRNGLKILIFEKKAQKIWQIEKDVVNLQSK